MFVCIPRSRHVVSASSVAMALASSSAPTGCTTVGAIGTSSATADVPATKAPSRYVVTATADNVPSASYPQAIAPSGPLAMYLSNAMNLASENSGSLGGVSDMWDSGSDVTTGLSKSALTVTATDPGGLVRIAVWTCPS